MNKKRMLVSLGFIFSAVVFFLIYRAFMPGPRLRSIIIADGGQLGSAPIYAAIEKGFFRNEGLEAIFDPFSYGKPALAALTEDRADFATAADAPFIHLVLQNKSLMLLASLSRADHYNRILFRPGSGIEKIMDFRGKKVGVPFSTSAEYFLYQLLNINGLEKSDVRTVDIEPAHMAEALKSGEVDAVTIWADASDEIQRQFKEPLTLISEVGIVSLYWNLYTRREIVEEEPELVGKVLKAVQKGMRWCESHERECQKITSRYNRQELKNIRQYWGSHQRGLFLSQTLLILLESQARWYLAAGRYEGSVPNFLNFIYSHALTRIQPESMTIIE